MADHSLDEHVAELLAEWEERRYEGRPVTPEELCGEEPELLESLREAIRRLSEADALLDTPQVHFDDSTPNRDSNAGGPPASETRGAGREHVPGDGDRLRPGFSRVDLVQVQTTLDNAVGFARGGMGEVFVATDRQLGRQIAVKLIQPQRAGDPSLEKQFLREAEITSRLEHPGIVPIHGIGTAADGRPCYTMRFVKGRTLWDAIQEFHDAERGPRDPGQREVAFRGLLNRFVAVCNTVAYAHSQGVIHRDIKPQNIQVGEFSETLLLDWGLSKQLDTSQLTTGGVRSDPLEGLEPGVAVGTHEPLDSKSSSQHGADELDSSRLTFTGLAKGTPAYMSPEQAVGDWLRVGPQSDIYSLGCTLFALLTGRAPVTGRNTPEILEQVQHGAAPRPIAIRRDVPKSLDAVCRKAMSHAVADRYTSATELAADIDRWLADEPVACLRDPLFNRARRWLKRHRSVFAGSAAAVIVAAVSLCGILVLVSRHNRVVIAKNSELLRLNQELRNSSAAAREQSSLALDTLKEVTFNVQRELNVKGAGPLRQRILETTVDRLHDVSNKFADRASIDRTTAAGLVDLAELIRRLGSQLPVRSRGASDSAGTTVVADFQQPTSRETSTAAAKRLFEKSRAIADALARENPSDRMLQVDRAVSRNGLGDISLMQGRLDDASHNLGEALAIVEALPNMDDQYSQKTLANTLTKLGEVSLRRRKLATACEHFGRTLDVGKTVFLATDRMDAQHLLIVTHIGLGRAHRDQGHFEDAARHFGDAITVAERFTAVDPLQATVTHDRVVAMLGLGDVYTRLGNVDQARTTYEKALKNALELDEQGSLEAQQLLATSYHHLGVVCSLANDVDSARTYLSEMTTIVQRQADADPDNVDVQRNRGVALGLLGEVYARAGDLDKAREALAKSLMIKEALAKDMADQRAQQDLWYVYFQLGQLEQVATNYSQAILWYEKARDKVEAIRSTRRPEEPQHNSGIFDRNIQQCLHELALQLIGRGQTGEAVSIVDKLRKLGSATASQLYDCACIYSLHVAALGSDDAQNDASRDELTKKALAALREAVAAGWSDIEHMRQDDDLAAVRHLPDFKELVQSPVE